MSVGPGSGLGRAFGRERMTRVSGRQACLRALAGQAKGAGPGVSRCTDLELRESSAALFGQLSVSGDRARVLPEALSVVSEAAHRSIGVAVTDSQMVASLAVFSGSVAELRDGEGKGIAAVLAAYLAVLTGMAAHVVTLDGYLARRDVGRARAILGFLGIDVHLADNPGGPGTGTYGDVTYGSYARFAGDYLEDNLVGAAADRVQGARDFAIIDEADTILVEESRGLVQIAADSGAGRAGQRQHVLLRSVLADSSSPPAAVKTILAECLVRDYFRGYRKLGGLTATAVPAAAEFRGFYGMDVVAVPASAADTRTDRYDLWFGGDERRVLELVMHAADRHRGGQPVLIRAESAGQVERISRDLSRYGIVPAVLRSGEDADAAAVMAGEVETSMPERLHHVDHRGGHGALGIGRVIGAGVGRRRPAVARQVRDHEGEVLLQLISDLVPHHVGLRVAMEQQQRRPAAARAHKDFPGRGIDPMEGKTGIEIGEIGHAIIVIEAQAPGRSS